MWYIVMQYLVSFLDLQSSLLGRDCFTLIVFLLPCGFKSYTFLPRGAVGCSVICDCSISRPYSLTFCQKMLALKIPITTKVVCFSRLPKCFRNIYGKQSGPRLDCSFRSSLFWVNAVCFYTQVYQIFWAIICSRRLLHMHFYWRFKG